VTAIVSAWLTLTRSFAVFRRVLRDGGRALVYPMFATDHEKEEWDGTVHG
jgi:hypothetical protein